jgi:hypothetical protein
MTFDDLSASSPCYDGCIIATVIRDHEQPVAGTQLAPDVREGRLQPCALVVSRHEDGTRFGYIVRRKCIRSARRGSARNNLKTKYGSRNRHKTGEYRE